MSMPNWPFLFTTRTLLFSTSIYTLPILLAKSHTLWILWLSSCFGGNLPVQGLFHPPLMTPDGMPRTHAFFLYIKNAVFFTLENQVFDHQTWRAHHQKRIVFQPKVAVYIANMILYVTVCIYIYIIYTHIYIYIHTYRYNIYI